MGLTAGIVGLPNVGKSTLFNAITNSKALAANYPFATIDPNIGFVDIHDERLYRIAEIIKPKKVVPTSFSFTDIAGLVKGASRGEGLGNQFLSYIREVDAVCQVVRCFINPDVAHIPGKIDPIGDIETINMELVISDYDIVEKRIPKLEKKAQLKVDPETGREYSALKKIANYLREGRFARECALTPAELQAVKPYNLLTLKPMIYVLNIDEVDITGDSGYAAMVRAKFPDVPIVEISAQIEAELVDLDPDHRREFLNEMGIKESGLAKLVRETYRLLELATFFTTAGEKEVRAWTFRQGMKAPECAGLVHTDFAKGFIKAEVVSYRDFIACGSLPKAREAGRIRSEGKDYPLQDGDIVLFRFNV
ncbi:MAG: redox-regulated ATPase YchF [Bacilli bacterium]|nr:redox-regulated ATPase YchF [Bacilli bacterium]